MLQQPFFQVTLPLMVTFIGALWAAQWSQNKRFEDLKDLIKGIEKRLDKIDEELKEIKKDITNIKERIMTIELARWK